MGESWISWKTTLSVFTILLQIRALTSVTTVTGVEGQTLSFRCEYSPEFWSNAKYFYRDGDDNPLIRTEKHDQWESNGRFSLYDNTTGAFIIIKVDKLVPEDSGTHLCGVDLSLRLDHISKIQLYVPREKPPENTVVQYNTVKPYFPMDFTLDKLHMSLFLTAVMCVAAILFVCLFTLCLLWAVKHQRSGLHQNREASSDYENMMPGVETGPELRCTSFTQDCADPSPAAAPPPDLCSHFTSKHRESTVTLGLGDYVDVDLPGSICQYQHLDFSQLEEHIYHSINGNSCPKDGFLGVKPQIN